MLEPIDLEFLGFAARDRRRTCVETDDGPALFDCGPATTLPRLKRGPARARPRADRHPASAALAHPPRPRRRGRDDRARASRAHASGSPRSARPHLVDPSRLEASARRLYGERLRHALGRARAGPGGEHLDRRGRRARLGGVPDARPCLAPRLLLPGRDAARRRRVRRPDPAVASTCFPVAPPPDIDLEAWHRTIAEIARREPDRLALIHFGVATDVAEHLDRLGAELDRWAELVRGGLDAEEFARRGARRRPDATPSSTTRSRRTTSRGRAFAATGRSAASCRPTRCRCGGGSGRRSTGRSTSRRARRRRRAAAT